MARSIHIRTRLKDYIRDVYNENATKSLPIMRSLSIEFPDDPKSWEEIIHYLFDSGLLIASAVTEDATYVPVYLPRGCDWVQAFTKKAHPGGQIYKIAVTLNTIPAFCKEGASSEHHPADIFGN